MSVSREQIKRIADLAELALDEKATAELEVQLNNILRFVEQLGELPTDDASHDERAARLRRDEPSADALLAPPPEWAPAMKGGLFTVPRLGELDTGDEA